MKKVVVFTLFFITWMASSHVHAEVVNFSKESEIVPGLYSVIQHIKNQFINHTGDLYLKKYENISSKWIDDKFVAFPQEMEIITSTGSQFSAAEFACFNVRYTPPTYVDDEREDERWNFVTPHALDKYKDEFKKVIVNFNEFYPARQFDPTIEFYSFKFLMGGRYSSTDATLVIPKAKFDSHQIKVVEREVHEKKSHYSRPKGSHAYDFPVLVFEHYKNSIVFRFIHLTDLVYRDGGLGINATKALLELRGDPKKQNSAGAIDLTF